MSLYFANGFTVDHVIDWWDGVGYVSIDSACCGSGRLGAETDCLPNSTLCADHDRFVFWDRTHPSQRAGELSAAAYFDGAAGFTAPISFHQLARKI
jgi:phospholipase/lecithinase/hemolysin